MDELEAYLAVLADTDVPDFEDPILEWWKVKERKWPALTKMVKQYIAAPASVGGCPASLLRSGQDASHGDLQKSAKGRHARALTDCRLQHGL